VSLVARHLEANGIPTVVIGCAKDIVEHCGVARLVFTDFPLGNPCGRPFDVEMQRSILEMSFELLGSARMPRTTVQTPYRWSDDETWKQLVLTKERPFLEGEHYEKWMKGKELYRKLKAEGRV
jgi:hypothetical protein